MLKSASRALVKIENIEIMYCEMINSTYTSFQIVVSNVKLLLLAFLNSTPEEHVSMAQKENKKMFVKMKNTYINLKSQMHIKNID